MDNAAEIAEATRLAVNLSVAGALLLALEVFFFNRIFAVFGACSLAGALFMAFKGYGLVVGMLFALGYVTVITLGFLIAIAYFPKLPFSQAYLKRTRARLAREEAEAEESAQKEAEEEGKE